ncbi:MAG: hypothetical protein RIC15_01050 [Vicingaceae bacterium]
MFIRPIIAAAVLITLFSCSKVAEETFSIGGIVRDSCTGAVVSGLHLFFNAQNENQNWVPPDASQGENLFTGGDGKFQKLLINDGGSMVVIWEQLSFNKFKAIGVVPIGESNFNLELVQYPTTDLEIILDVKNAKTDQDTLRFINPSTGLEERIPGPFTSGFLMDIPAVPYQIAQNPPTFYLGYEIGLTSVASGTAQQCGSTEIGLVIE